MPSDWNGRLETVREPQRLSTGAILGVGLGTAAFLVVALAGLWFFFDAARRPPPWPPLARMEGIPLQSDPAGDLRDHLADQRRRLHAHGWIDRERGLIQVPIERAMAIVAARGTAAYDPPAAPPSDERPVAPAPDETPAAPSPDATTAGRRTGP